LYSWLLFAVNSSVVSHQKIQKYIFQNLLIMLNNGKRVEQVFI
jgi:hypothetical protein